MFDKDQEITIYIGDKEYFGKFIKEREFHSIPFIVMKEYNSTKNLTYINVFEISAFSCEDFEQTEQEKKLDALKKAGILDENNNVAEIYRNKKDVSRADSTVYSKPLSIPKEKQMVQEPEIESPPIQDNKLRALTLAQLYEERRKTIRDDLAKKMKNKEIIPQEVQYELPSFQQHPKK